MARDGFLDPAEVRKNIRFHAKLAARRERGVEIAQKIILDETAPLVVPLRPRIGEKDVREADHARWEQMFHRVGAFEPEQPEIGQAGALGLADDVAHASEEALGAEEIALG